MQRSPVDVVKLPLIGLLEGQTKALTGVILADSCVMALEDAGSLDQCRLTAPAIAKNSRQTKNPFT
jgi:hypothetical protein